MSGDDNNNASKLGNYVLFILLFVPTFFALQYFTSNSEDEEPSSVIAPEAAVVTPSKRANEIPQEPKPEAPKLAELEPEKSQPVRVRADYEICSKVSSSSKNFLDQISLSIGVSSRNIEIIGGIYGGAGDRCKINIMTPLGVMECNSGYIYTDDGGDSYFTRGTEIGVNNSCYKISS
jgi:hypothetical protein